jgi:hypothetical protein
MTKNQCFVPRHETLGLEGLVTIKKRYLDGRIETIYSETKNLITNSGKLLALRTLFPSGGVGDPIFYAKVGDGGAFDVDGLLLKTPTPDLTDLYHPLATVGVGKVAENPADPSITLVASVDNAQANGVKINEAGFFSAAGVMFNIKTFPGTLKNNTFSLDFEWKIRVV